MQAVIAIGLTSAADIGEVTGRVRFVRTEDDPTGLPSGGLVRTKHSDERFRSTFVRPALRTGGTASPARTGDLLIHNQAL